MIKWYYTASLMIGELKNFVATDLSYNAKLGATDDPISATLLALRMMDTPRLGSQEYMKS